VRLLADADLNAAGITWYKASGAIRRNPELDFKRAEDVPLEGLDDEAVLNVAARDRRILVSHDVTTMPDHFREYTRRRVSPGVILVPQNLSIGRAIENIIVICEACGEADLENRICLVPSLVMYGF
jgi:predicted nuclease of predicted toxin-antitoxin system